MDKFYTGKRILITGSNGYLGSNLVELLQEFDCHIICLDKTETLQNVREKSRAEISSIKCDIVESEDWEKTLKGIDIIFHFAGQTSVYIANENPVSDFSINVLPFIRILETCKKSKFNPIIIFAGTATEVGMPENFPVDERHPDKPVTIYDLHKLMAENYLKYYAEAGIIQGAILRLANVYGPGPKSSNADRGILNMMIRKALNGENLTLYGKGENLRDYIYVEDVVKAFLLAGIKIEGTNGRHLILGTGESHSLREAFEMVIQNVFFITGKKVNLISVDPPNELSPIESRNFVADIRLIRGLVGWEPKINLNSGIINTIKYYHDEKH